MRGVVPVAVACIVHAGVVAGLAARRPSPQPLVIPPTNPGEIDLQEAPDGPERPPGAPASRPDSRNASEGTSTSGRNSALAGLAPTEFAPTTSPANAAEAPPDGWSFSPVVRHIDTTGAFTRDLAYGESRSADPSAPAPASTTGGLAEGLAAHDVEVGLGRGGSILTAAENAARSSDAPLRGDATFDVVVFPDGKVDARLAGASVDTDGWREVARAVERSVDGHRVRVPPGARGWRVVVRVEAKVVFADGRDTRSVHGPRASVTPSALSNAIDGKPGARGSSTAPGGPDHVDGVLGAEAPPVGGALGPEKAPHAGASAAIGLAARILPTPTLSVEGKVCSAALAITPVGVSIGGGCSLENIGTGTRRAVSGRIVREEAL